MAVNVSQRGKKLFKLSFLGDLCLSKAVKRYSVIDYVRSAVCMMKSKYTREILSYLIQAMEITYKLFDRDMKNR